MTTPDRIERAVGKVQAVSSGWFIVDKQDAIKLLRRKRPISGRRQLASVHDRVKE
jgi:hypothetical protein